MNQEGRPILIVVAGPNGSGKTTITEKLLRHEWMDGCVYVNPKKRGQTPISCSVNGDWRVTFRFEAGDAVLVNYQDYH